MQVIDINIQALNFKLPLAQYEYIERRLSYALNLHVDQITAVQVWLSAVNDSELHVDRRCLLQITLIDGLPVVIESVEADLAVAVHRAADQAGWTVARRLVRRKIQQSATFHSSIPKAAEPRWSSRM